MRTLLWSYLGQRQFPREMSRFEIRHFFSGSRSTGVACSAVPIRLVKSSGSGGGRMPQGRVSTRKLCESRRNSKLRLS
jgi:hypothetical protein